MKSHSWSAVRGVYHLQVRNSSIPLLCRLWPAFSEIQKILSVNCENLLEGCEKEQIHPVSLYHFGVALRAPHPPTAVLIKELCGAWKTLGGFPLKMPK